MRLLYPQQKEGYGKKTLKLCTEHSFKNPPNQFSWFNWSKEGMDTPTLTCLKDILGNDKAT